MNYETFEEQKHRASDEDRTEAEDFSAVVQRVKMKPFESRILSDGTVRILLAKGIRWPEQLLFLRDAEINRLAGPRSACRKEVRAYRARFLPKRNATPLIGVNLP